MKKRYIIVLAGMMLGFVMLTGCGMNRTVRQTQTSDNSSTQREEELQAEIDALQREIDELKGSQESKDQQSTDSADNSQTTDGGQTSAGGQTSDNSTSQSDNSTPQSGDRSSHHSSGSTSNVTLSLEEAQNIALERVPGATPQDMSIELDYDDGWYIYEGDILYNRMEYEFEIDANTGNILKWEEERW